MGSQKATEGSRPIAGGSHRMVVLPSLNLPLIEALHRFGEQSRAENEPLLFHEYFHAEKGLGLGASHQTGWTSVVARLAQDAARPKALGPEPMRRRN